MEPFFLRLQNRPRPRPRCFPACDPPAPLAILGLFWRHLGLSWGHLGAILGLPGATLPLHYPRRSQSTFFAPAFCRCEMLVFGILLPWLFPELRLEHSWGHLGPSWAILKPPWSHLGPYRAHLGPIFGLPGAILAEFMQICQGKFRATQDLPRQIFV